MGRSPSIDELAERQPGEDPIDPYAEIDVEALPEWWKRAIREYEDFNLRPYRPPRFQDGIPAPVVINHLEERYDISFKIMVISEEEHEFREVSVDGDLLMEIPVERSPAGFTLYKRYSRQFRNAVERSFG